MARTTLAALFLIGYAAAGDAFAASPSDIQRSLETEVRQSVSGFTGFSAQRGEQFFNARHGGNWTCATCHTADPRQPGRHATMSELNALFPSASASLASLVDAGLVRVTKTERYRSPQEYVEHAAAPELTSQQQAVVDAVVGASGSFQTFLLQGVTAAGKSTACPAEMVDFYPTLAELCDLTPPPYISGVSLAPALRDPTARPRTAALTQFASGYSLRTDRYRYTEWGDDGAGGVELYDHKTDPAEMANLASKASEAEVIAGLSAQLRARIAEARRKPEGVQQVRPESRRTR